MCLPFFFIGILAMALSTMTALFSATLCTLRYDLLLGLRSREGGAADEAKAERHALAAGGALCLVILVAAYLLEEGLGPTEIGEPLYARGFANFTGSPAPAASPGPRVVVGAMGRHRRRSRRWRDAPTPHVSGDDLHSSATCRTPWRTARFGSIFSIG